MNGAMRIRHNGAFVAAMLAAVGVLGVVDWATGYEFNFFVFYFLPIGVTAWRAGLRSALGIAIASVVMWFLADAYSAHPWSHDLLRAWAGFVRLASFVLVAYTFARIRALLVDEQRKNEALEKALSEVKTLSGLLPICASCKKIRDDEGYWRRIEEYFGKHTDVRFTHGLCTECLKEYRRDAGLDERISSN